jgi:CheY-like chemotaxis protein
MNRQLRHLTHLVDDLLDVSRISRGKLVLRRDNVMFEDIVAAAVVECGDALEADGRTLTLHPPEEPVFVWADEVRLTQVLTNLLGNAAKYTRPGGQIELAWQADGTEVSIVVRDNGLGISPEFLEHMFERFAQERGDGRGLGLGLALSRQIVELHAGSLTARSPGPGEGSVFEVKLPAASSAAIVRPRSPEEATVPDRPLRIVVVDDDDDVRELTCALLRRWHHEVAAAPAAPEGIQRIREQDPDVALVDIAMPGMDGHELAEAVRREHPVRPRLVAVSGYGRQEDRERARSSGYDALLVKPVEPEVLRTILGQLAREMSTRPSGPEVDVPGEGRSKDGSDDDEQRDQADVVRDPGSPGPPAHSGRVAWLRAR